MRIKTMENNKATQINIDLINSINISSDRLLIKKFTEADIQHNVKHEMDPELMRYIRDPISLEETTKKTKKCAEGWNGDEGDWTLFSVRLKGSNQYIGMVCFKYESIESDTVEIGWRLGHEYHGKGYATEAAQRVLDFIIDKIKPHKVVAYCIAENTASSNIMTKLGMEQEGHLRQCWKLRGNWQDSVIFGIILN